MSYNVGTWKTKEIVDLVIPVESLFACRRSDWHPKRIHNGDGTTEFKIAETCSIVGKVTGSELFVSLIQATGEGSGTALEWIIEPALKRSRGRFVAVVIWEDDSIERLTVIDGDVSSQEVEL